MSGAADSAQCLVVSGFLGSGKTTLVRRLLEQGQADGIRTAVVSNEFGELGIDQALLASTDGDFVELAGGCVCCRLSDDLLKTLEQLWQRSHPQRVIVETSGVALPYDTLVNFWREPVSQWAIDASSVVVASAVQLAEGRDLDSTFEDQVCSADLLILSKTDLLGDAEADRAEALLGQIQAGVPILRATFGDVDARVFFPPEPGSREATRPDEIRDARGSYGELHAAHDHDAYVCEEIVFRAGVEEAEIQRTLAERAALRSKGFVETAQGPRIVQGVSTHIELTAPKTPPPPHLLGRVVVIEHRRAAATDQATVTAGEPRP